MRNALVSGLSLVTLASLVACGGAPPPKVEEPVKEDSHERRGGPNLQMSQELGSIDQRAVEKTFAGLVSGPLENCHKQGRDRVEVLTGDVKIFLRIDPSGRVKYGYFEDSTLGDRDTEKCIMGIFSGTSWPKPEGGEAEVRSGFGWGPGGERAPTSWSSDKVTTALAESKHVRKDLDKCRGSVKGDFRVTAYVEPGAPEHAGDEASAGTEGKAKKPAAKPKAGAPHPTKPGSGEAGHFKAIGMAPPNKEGAEKVDCLVEALKQLELPSPGSYVAKVTFSL